MMGDTLIKFETAKLAKEKGFKEYTTMVYCGTPEGLICVHKIVAGSVKYENVYQAPTQSALQAWFRNKHMINFIPPLPFDNRFSCTMVINGRPSFPTYEEALEDELLLWLHSLPNID